MYSQEGQFDLNVEEFYGKLTLHKVSGENIIELQRPTTLEELDKVIKISLNGKTPGLDGISNKFDKKMFDFWTWPRNLEI